MIKFIYSLINKLFNNKAKQETTRSIKYIDSRTICIDSKTIDSMSKMLSSNTLVPKENKIIINQKGYEILCVMNTYHDIYNKKVKGSLCYMKVIDEESKCNTCELLPRSFKDNPYKCKHCKKCEHSNNGFAHSCYRYRYLNIDDII